MTRVTGAAVGIAGLTFIGLGTAGVSSITGVVGHATTATCATDTLVPSGNACVNETDEGTTAATNGAANDCGQFDLVQNSTTDGWVFVLPQGDSDGDTAGEGNTFVTVTAVFDTGTLPATVTGPPTGQKAVVSAPAGSILLEAYATVTDDASSDGDNTLFFQVTGVCVASGTTTTTTPTTTTTTTPTTTTTTPTTTTTTTPTTTTTTTPTTTTTTTPSTTTTTTPTTTTSTTTSGASGSLGLTTTTTSTGAGGVLGITTTTPSTGADTEFGAGLALLMLGGGLVFGSTRLSRRKRQ